MYFMVLNSQVFYSPLLLSLMGMYISAVSEHVVTGQNMEGSGICDGVMAARSPAACPAVLLGQDDMEVFDEKAL